MSKLLVVVDMQNDFISGVLGTEEALEIVPNVVGKIRSYRDAGEKIVFTQDTHFPNYLETLEGKNLPIEHCLKGSWGWEFVEEIKALVSLEKHQIFEKHTFACLEMARTLCESLEEAYSSIEIVGLCTDICVVSNALLLKAFLPETPISVSASCCAGIAPHIHEAALRILESCQIEITP